MTQDQAGRAQDTGYVVRGHVVPDDEIEAPQAGQTGPMTRLKKVASAFRGDRPDEAAADQTATTDADATRDDWEDDRDTDAAVPDEGATAAGGMALPGAVARTYQ